MRILIVTGTYGNRSNPWLLDDLAREFVTAGHTVDVVVHDATGARPRGLIATDIPGLTALSVGSTKARKGRVQKLFGYMQAGIGLHTDGYRFARRNTYDLCISTSIASFSWGFPSRVRRRKIARLFVLVLWDFFPIHQLEIGRIRRGPASRLMKTIEGLAISDADVVALMTPANEAFFRSYFPRLNAQTIIVPPWSSSGSVFDDGVVKRDRFTVIFGGQLAKGRGVETLLHAAAELARSGEAIDIVIAGDGSERNRLQTIADDLRLSNVHFVGAIPRDAYRVLLSSAHVGIAITVPGVTPPTFPSKIVEYCGLGIPVVVCVETSSDAGDTIERRGAGLKVTAGNASDLAAAIRTMHLKHIDLSLPLMATAAHDLYLSEFSTKSAVRRFETVGTRS